MISLILKLIISSSWTIAVIYYFTWHDHFGSPFGNEWWSKTTDVIVNIILGLSYMAAFFFALMMIELIINTIQFRRKHK